MTILYRDNLFLEHDTGLHPESPQRLRYVHRRLDEAGLTARCTAGTIEPVSLPRLERIHKAAYVEQVRQFAAHGGGRIEADTIVSPRSYDVALRATGAVCNAVERVARGEDASALCLVRPPGHHALKNSPMGFCLFNNIAVGAQLAVDELGLDRVLIVDWDVHHGNGTQNAFWESGRVGFFSVHRWPFYPGTGAADETGAGEGLGATMNLPLPFGIPRDEYMERVTSSLESFAERIRPQLVLISAGFDAHARDPVGSLGLEVEDFAVLTRLVRGIADAYCGGKIVSVLEGGYNPADLADCVAAHLEQLLAKE